MKAQNSLYAPYRWIDERTFITKSAEAVRFYRLQGLDWECATDDQMEARHHRIQTAVLSMPEGIRLKFYWAKLDRVSVPRQEHANPIVQSTLDKRADFLEHKPDGKLATMELRLALVFEPKQGLPTLPGSIRKVSRRQLVKQQAALSQAESILHQAHDLLGIEPMSREDTFEYLAFLSTMDLDLAKAQRGLAAEESQIDRWLANLPSRANPWRGIKIGKIQPIVLSLDKAPDKTWPNSLRPILALSGRILVCAEWKREPIAKSVQKLKHAEGWFEFVKYFRNIPQMIRILLKEGEVKGEIPDKKVEQDKERANEERLRLQSGKGATHGWMGFTAVCFSDNAEENEKAALGLQTIFANQLGRLIREHGYAYGPFLNLVPGTTPQYGKLFRQRVRKFPLNQFLDVAPIYNHAKGESRNPVTGRPALLQLVTNDGTLFDFNLVPKNAALTGCLIVGVQGSGKSTFQQACIDHSMKDDPFTLILDGIGGSYRLLTRKHGGSYADLDPETEWPFTMNPFRTAYTKNNCRYLAALVETCFSAGGYRRNAESSLVIYRDVQRILRDEPFEKRRISLLDLPAKLEPYLAPWIRDGPNAHLFDNAEDTFSIARFQTVDFAKLIDFPEIVQPLLFHLFYRWNLIVNDDKVLTTPKNLYIDEGWNMLRFKKAQRYLTSGMRTYRKRLGGFVLATQSITEFRNEGLLELTRELCPLAILLANPNGDFDEYSRVFKLNAKETELYSALYRPGSGLMKSAARSQVFHTPLDAEALWCYANDPFSNEKRNRALAAHQGDLQAALAALAKGA